MLHVRRCYAGGMNGKMQRRRICVLLVRVFNFVYEEALICCVVGPAGCGSDEWTLCVKFADSLDRLTPSGHALPLKVTRQMRQIEIWLHLYNFVSFIVSIQSNCYLLLHPDDPVSFIAC